jgi:hypothetical protein
LFASKLKVLVTNINIILKIKTSVFAPIEENVYRNMEMATKKMIRSLNQNQILLLAKLQAQYLICQKQEAELVDVTPTLPSAPTRPARGTLC